MDRLRGLRCPECGLKTPDVLHEVLSSDVTIRPSLSAFDRALTGLKSKAGS